MPRGDIVPVPFPFDDLSSMKVRPAVCLTDPIGPHRHVVLAFISSVIPDSPLATDIVLDPQSTTGFASLGLHKASVLRLHRLLTISERLFQRSIGHVNRSLWHSISATLRDLFS